MVRPADLRLTLLRGVSLSKSPFSCSSVKLICLEGIGEVRVHVSITKICQWGPSEFKLVGAWKLGELEQVRLALTAKLYSASSTNGEEKICKYGDACTCTLKLFGMIIQSRLVIL